VPAATSLLWLAAVALIVYGSMCCSATAQAVMKLGHDSPLDSPFEVAAEWFKHQVESKSNGRVKVQIFPNAQLGDESTMINGLKIGSVDALYTSSGPISQSVNEVDLLSLPFLFKDGDQALRAVNGRIGEVLNPKIESALAAKVAGWGFTGERDMWNGKRPIKTIADLKGLKMRIQQSAVQKDTYEALGALATPISYGELYTSLQTGVVDGADNGPADVEEDKFYQVTKYMTLTRHFLILVPMLISDKFLATLSPDDQKLVLDLGKQSGQILTDAASKKNAEALEKLKTQGLQVFELSDADRKAFVDAVQSVYKKNADHVGGQALVETAMDTP
jgi:tripartite ATP-independent transporter DctP family solute receptor